MDLLMKCRKKKLDEEPDDFASGGIARVGFKNGKGVDLDRRMILKGMGALAALPVVGKFFKWVKPLAKRDIRVKMKPDMDWSYQGPESGWEGGSWLNLDFVPLTKKGTKILDDLAKDKKIIKDKSGAYYANNSEDGLIAVENIKNKKGGMELETSVHDKVKGSMKGEYETTKVYSGKDIDSKKILRESSDLATDSPYHDNVFQDEFTEEIINTIKKEKMASGGIAGQLHLNRQGFPFGGSALKAIREAWRANKTWGVGGPPYKPEATSFNIKEMTKRNLGTELSLTDLRRLSESPLAGPQKGHFEDFNKQFKNIKASILREKMMERKLEAKAAIEAAEKTMKEAIADPQKYGGNLEMSRRITSQMTRESKKSLEEVNEGLKAIDIYMGMLQKKGRRLHASGGLAHVLGV